MLVRSLSLGETDKLRDRIYGRESSAWLGRRLKGERGGSPVHYVRLLATSIACV
jgi:hypothetical protein